MKVKRNMVVIDMTTKLNKKIDEVFAEYPAKYKEKVKFLLYLINRENKGYQLNQANHKHFFSLSGGQQSLNIMIKLLVDHGVIRKGKGYDRGKYSNTYHITPEYFYKNKTGTLRTYYRDLKTLPTFIKRFMVDNYVVKSVINTEYNKNVQIEIISKSEKESEENLENTLLQKIGDQDRLIAELKATIKAMQGINKGNTELSESDKIEDKEEIEIVETPILNTIRHDDFDDLKNIEFDDMFAPTKLVIKEESKEIPEVLQDYYHQVKELITGGLMQHKALDEVFGENGEKVSLVKKIQLQRFL